MYADRDSEEAELEQAATARERAACAMEAEAFAQSTDNLEERVAAIRIAGKIRERGKRE